MSRLQDRTALVCPFISFLSPKLVNSRRGDHNVKGREVKEDQNLYIFVTFSSFCRFLNQPGFYSSTKRIRITV